ncbi:MAG: hypothetical protein NVS2B16_30210 [Chloroflexota bacterium]
MDDNFIAERQSLGVHEYPLHDEALFEPDPFEDRVYFYGDRIPRMTSVHKGETGDRERQAALSWIRYWKASAAAGGQSWLGGEQDLEEIMRLHKQIAEYDKRVALN